MKKKYQSWLLACLFFTVEDLTAQTNSDLSDSGSILLNGGFESGAPEDFGALTGWDVYGNLGAQPVGFTRTKIGPGPSYFPKEGVRMAIFSAGSNDFGGAVSQEFVTIPGAIYHVKMKMGVASEAVGRKQVLQVSVADGGGAMILSRIEYVSSLAKGTTWRDFGAMFIAAGKKSRITIQDLSEILPLIETYNTDLIIDGISVIGKTLNNNITKTGN
jgi:hypothetical protein